jgi:hypothetical protein
MRVGSQLCTPRDPINNQPAPKARSTIIAPCVSAGWVMHTRDPINNQPALKARSTIIAPCVSAGRLKDHLDMERFVVEAV